MQIKPSHDLNSGDYAAAMYGLLFSERDEALERARVLNSYRQTNSYRAAISQTHTGYWQVWEPGMLAQAGRDTLAKVTFID